MQGLGQSRTECPAACLAERRCSMNMHVSFLLAFRGEEFSAKGFLWSSDVGFFLVIYTFPLQFGLLSS